ncbi:DJ-1/PfpI family protein [Streptomyces sp. NPDC059629]|uniref:DJ-1/PfpI family protein n=1 Tax=Streptomyces sp. NPDC059629 TaxID=3346889 RepID=UPI0036B49DFF
MRHNRHIVFIVFDGMKMLDVTGPAEVFAEANTLVGGYTLSFVSPNGRPVTTSIGVQFSVSGAVSATQEADTLILPGVTASSQTLSLPASSTPSVSFPRWCAGWWPSARDHPY